MSLLGRMLRWFPGVALACWWGFFACEMIAPLEEQMLGTPGGGPRIVFTMIGAGLALLATWSFLNGYVVPEQTTRRYELEGIARKREEDTVCRRLLVLALGALVAGLMVWLAPATTEWWRAGGFAAGVRGYGDLAHQLSEQLARAIGLVSLFLAMAMVHSDLRWRAFFRRSGWSA